MVAAAATSTVGVAHRQGSPAQRLLGAASLALAAAHLLILVLIPHSLPWMLGLLAMTLWCAKCSWCVWRGGSAGSLMAMCALMGVAHMAMVLGMPWFAGHHGAHAQHPPGHAAVMLLVALGEFILMFAAALVIRGRRSRVPWNTAGP
ncbi:hypothetical protein OK351_00055 [Glutamicibacter sp. MNS18]|uniref:hypothetical protein n=1 Tax=Glutamicibacter sp. MNS18 TaxID=2989817 RepID=UPI002236497A|nr:hypothetical protein [Glutamicibacter sp. MNS18]MCW4463907.1 hypothetical protein [Glutamicibacter sp. MNS18]